MRSLILEEYIRELVSSQRRKLESIRVCDHDEQLEVLIVQLENMFFHWQ